MWGSSIAVYFFGVLDLLESVSDIILFGIIAMAMIFGVGLALVGWAKDFALRKIGWRTVE